MYPSTITVVADPRPALTIAWVNSPPLPVKVTGGRTVSTPDLPKNKILVAGGGTDIIRVFDVAVDIVTIVNPDSRNALFPILVTELGIVIDVIWVLL